MGDNFIWEFNEKIQAGADFSDVERALVYDDKMQEIRNYKERTKQIVEMLSINKSSRVIELGSGTGTVSIEIAKVCEKVYAIDISRPMLEIAQKKAVQEKVNNIEFINSGFLSYEHQDEPVDYVISIGAFHHLSDFWKAIALLRMNRLLKKNGLLFLADVIFSFDIKDYCIEINKFLEGIRSKTDEEFYKDAVLHIKEEYSTFDWVMDEMLKRTDFEIIKKAAGSKTHVDYICKKSR